MSAGGAPLPPLRALDVTPTEDPSGQRIYLLRDPLGVSPNVLSLSPAACLLLSLLDGQRTVADLQDGFLEASGQRIAAAQIEEMMAVLDDALMLDNARARDARQAAVDAYRAADARDNRARWPETDVLRASIAEMFAARPKPAAERELPGAIVAPHLDYPRGEPCYVAAHAQLTRVPAGTRFVILGTNHFGRARCVVATRKDFLTPLGRAPTDRPFVERMEAELGESLCAEEFDHAAEHSIELQVHLLQARLDVPFEIVPVLCPDPSGPTGTAPADGRGVDLGDFADCLGRLVRGDDRPTILIASADLSHVGRAFGDAQPTSTGFLASISRRDQELLALLEAGRPDAFVDSVRGTQNATRICSVGCMYAAARALDGASFRLLKYHLAANIPAETSVSCAAARIG